MNYKKDEYGNLFTKLNGEYHSFNDMPAEIYTNGYQRWRKEGNFHRDSHFPGREDDLPAIICDNKAEWWIDGKYIKSCDGYTSRTKSARNI